MAIAFNGGILVGGSMNGKSLGEAWLNGVKIYPVFSPGVWTTFSTGNTTYPHDQFGIADCTSLYSTPVCCLSGGISNPNTNVVVSEAIVFSPRGLDETKLNPYARISCAGCSHNGYPYYCGGKESGGSVEDGTMSTMVERTGQTPGFVQKASMPARVQVASMASTGDYIYIFGGYDRSQAGNRTNRLYMYNPSSDTYTLLSFDNSSGVARPSSRHGVAMVYNSKDNSLYLFGGYTTQTVSDAYKYYINTSTWTRLTSMPSVKRNMGIVIDESRQHIYLIGGENDANKLKTVYEYHILEDKYYEQTSLPQVSGDGRSWRDTSTGNIYHFFGRLTSTTSNNNIYKFTPTI